MGSLKNVSLYNVLSAVSGDEVKGYIYGMPKLVREERCERIKSMARQKP